jgi:hypothetical protein
MRTPKFTTKRALGLALATTLALGGTFTLAGGADAAAAAYKTASPTTSAGQIVTVLGTNFTNDNGAALFDTTKVIFQTAACSSTVGSNNGTVSVISDTTLRVTTPTAVNVPLTSSKPTKYNLCFYKPSAGALLGTTSVTVYAVPTFSAAIDNSSGPSYGGTKITVTGQDFTSKTGITVGGVAATNVKATLGKTSSDDDVVVGYTPRSSSTTAQTVKVVGEFGAIAYVFSATPQNFTYTNAVKVSPSGSDGTAGRVITVNGSGFNDLALAAAPATSKSAIVLVKAGTTINTALLYSSGYVAPGTTFQACASPTVISDSEVTCTIPALTGAYGAYTVAVVTMSAADALVSATSTGYSRGATYTVAPF